MHLLKISSKIIYLLDAHVRIPAESMADWIKYTRNNLANPGVIPNVLAVTV